jgi:hypothetical protein
MITTTLAVSITSRGLVIVFGLLKSLHRYYTPMGSSTSELLGNEVSCVSRSLRAASRLVSAVLSPLSSSTAPGELVAFSLRWSAAATGCWSLRRHRHCHSHGQRQQQRQPVIASTASQSRQKKMAKKTAIMAKYDTSVETLWLRMSRNLSLGFGDVVVLSVCRRRTVMPGESDQ